MERRGALRRVPACDEPIARVRFRAGSHLAVIDVSNAGALVEGSARLLPGTHVDVHIITADGRTLVRSRVVRAYVAHLEAELIRYRGALAFERSIDTASVRYAASNEDFVPVVGPHNGLGARSAPEHTVGYPVPEVLASHTAPQGNGYPHDHPHIAHAHQERPSAHDS